MRPWIVTLTLMVTLASSDGVAKKPADPLDEVRAKVCAVLSNLEPNPKDRDKAEEALRRELYSIVDAPIAKLRPPKGVKTCVSRDKAFVLVIGANGINGGAGNLGRTHVSHSATRARAGSFRRGISGKMLYETAPFPPIEGRGMCDLTAGSE